jgi:hypothetical protein
MPDELDNGANWRTIYATWSLEALVSAALDELAVEEADDSASYFPAIATLQSRGERDVLVAMTHLLTSPQPRERCLGARILAQMQQDEGDYHAFQAEAVTALLEAIAQEHDSDVLTEICIALGHRCDPRAIAPLAALADHPNALVRYGVAFGLGDFGDPLAVAALIKLSNDAADQVRDWATFAFTWLEVDTPAVRAALRARVNDPDIDTRSEAIAALANRHDPAAVPALLATLADGANGTPIYEAAIALADVRLYPALIARRDHWTGNDWDRASLDEAIAACEPASPITPE